MDKNTKNSLLFGAVVGGLFALGRNAAEKQKLTPNQLKDINAFKENMTRLQGIVSDQSLAEAFNLTKQHETDKQYASVLAKIDERIQAHYSYLGLVDSFGAALNHILSPSFTAQRSNANTAKAQSNFSSLSPLPQLMGAFINKRIEILRLVQKSLGYIAAGEATDFKPDDAALLRSLVGELKSLEARVVGMLESANLSR